MAAKRSFSSPTVNPKSRQSLIFDQILTPKKMANKLKYNMIKKNYLVLLTLLVMASSCISQDDNKGKHIKINIEKDGQTLSIDTVIPPGTDFDYNAFLQKHGLEGTMNVSDEEIQIEIDDSGNAKTVKKSIQIEDEEMDGQKIVTKKVRRKDDQSSEKSEEVEITKTVDKDGVELTRIMINGKELTGSEKERKLKEYEQMELEMRESSNDKEGKKVIIIEEEIEESEQD